MAKSVRSWATGLIGITFVALASSCSSSQDDAFEPSGSLSQEVSLGARGVGVNTAYGKIELYELTTEGRVVVTERRFATPCANTRIISEPMNSGPAATGGLAAMVFARGRDNALWYRGDGPIRTFVSLGGNIVSAPAAVKTLDGRVFVFARGADNAIHYRFRYNSKIWSEWRYIPAQVTSGPAVTADAESGLHIFVRGIDGAIAWYTLGDTGDARLWRNLRFGSNEGFTSAPAAVMWPSGVVDIAARGPNGHLHHTSCEYGICSEWQDLGADTAMNINAPALAIVEPGYGEPQLRAYFRSPTGTLKSKGLTTVGWTPAATNCAEPMPSVPRDLGITVNRTSVTVYWTNDPPGAVDEDYFVINNLTTSTRTLLPSEQGPSVHVIGGLWPGTRYCFDVSACNYGGCSRSNTVCGVTQP